MATGGLRVVLREGFGRYVWTLGACALALAPAAFAFQEKAQDAAKDADLPEALRKLPFEIKDGYRKFVKRCTTCHDAKRVEEAKKSLFEWQGVIGTMAFKKGADIPQDDRQSIFLYLAYLHGTKGTPEEKDQYLTFLVKCEDCHGISLVYKDKQPMKEWPGIVHRMAGKNQAQISADDEKKIMGYINRMHPDLFGVE
jgi:nitrate/TMAO reductase-like tetraheme cytochrome c subunit